MTLDAWLESASADLERRGLPQVVAMLPGLVEAIARVRAADWNVTVAPACSRPADADTR